MGDVGSLLEDYWSSSFAASDQPFSKAGLVIFDAPTDTGGCGVGTPQAGPFYCPADRKVYLDTAFFRELSQRFGAPGDFAAAYVIAHEVGHHVQNELGTMQQFDQTASRMDARQRNALSVRLELQADCLAGVWAHHSQKAKAWLEPGDVEEGLNAASKIGDDTLQRKSQGVVVPESFTHGSSAQRVNWFKKGLTSGSMAQCNTFESRAL